MRLTIAGVGSQLQGVARSADGRAVFVPGALPGETVEVEIINERPRFMEARLLDVLEASAHRVASPCPYAHACGGCAAMHIGYAGQRALKRQKVVDAMTRLGGQPDAIVLDPIGMPEPMRTRNKAEYAIGNRAIGLRAAGSHAIVEVDDCLTQSELSTRAMRATRDWLKGQRAFSGYLVTRVNRAGQLMCVLASDRAVDTRGLSARLFAEVPGMASMYECRLAPRASHALDGACAHVSGAGTLAETLGGLTFELSPQSFFQVNTVGAESLYLAAVDCARLTGREDVLDAYSGAGTITLAMARAAKRATGIEIVPEAVADAKANARANGLESKAEFHRADAAKWLPGAAKKGFSPDVACVDPPRKGVDPAFIEALKTAKPGRVVYVSCDPATLARDVKRLCEGEAYALKSVQPVDMFPFTHHVECVALLTRA